MDSHKANHARAQPVRLLWALGFGAALIAGAAVLHVGSPGAIILAGYLPMPSAAMRLRRVRALAKKTARKRIWENEQREREAYARRLIAELRRVPQKPQRSPEQRERRRAVTAQARAAEAARINLAVEAKRAIADFNYHAETVRLRDEHVFAPSDDICRGRELPPLNEDGHVPGHDATGRVLGIVDGRLAYKRRTRLFAEIAFPAALRLQAVIKQYPAEAACMAIVREARALFWNRLREMRERDRAQEAGS